MITPAVPNPVFMVTNLAETLQTKTLELALENAPVGQSQLNPMMGGSPNSMTIRANVAVFDLGLIVGKTYAVTFTEVVPAPAP